MVNGMVRDQGMMPHTIYGSGDGGKYWKLIAIRLYNLEVFVYTVLSLGTEKTTCKIEVLLKDDSGKTLRFDVSDSYFTIQPPS